MHLSGELQIPQETLYKKNVLVVRGRFRPFTLLHNDMLQGALLQHLLQQFLFVSAELTAPSQGQPLLASLLGRMLGRGCHTVKAWLGDCVSLLIVRALRRPWFSIRISFGSGFAKIGSA